MAYCKECGVLIEGESAFCVSCGARLGQSSAPPPRDRDYDRDRPPRDRDYDRDPPPRDRDYDRDRPPRDRDYDRGPPPPRQKSSGSKSKMIGIVVAVVIIVIVVAALSAYFLMFSSKDDEKNGNGDNGGTSKTMTYEELSDDYDWESGNFKSLNSGDTVQVKDKIDEIDTEYWENSTYTYISFASYSEDYIYFKGDLTSQFSSGDNVIVTIHITEEYGEETIKELDNDGCLPGSCIKKA